MFQQIRIFESHYSVISVVLGIRTFIGKKNINRIIIYLLVCFPHKILSSSMVAVFCYTYPLEMEMAAHSSIPVWEIQRAEEPGWVHSMGSQQSDMT